MPHCCVQCFLTSSMAAALYRTEHQSNLYRCVCTCSTVYQSLLDESFALIAPSLDLQRWKHTVPEPSSSPTLCIVKAQTMLLGSVRSTLSMLSKHQLCHTDCLTCLRGIVGLLHAERFPVILFSVRFKFFCRVMVAGVAHVCHSHRQQQPLLLVDSESAALLSS